MYLKCYYCSLEFYFKRDDILSSFIIGKTLFRIIPYKSIEGQLCGIFMV